MSTVSHVSVDFNSWFLDPQGSCDHMPGAQEGTFTAKRVLLLVSHASPGKLACGLQITKGWKHCLKQKHFAPASM